MKSQRRPAHWPTHWAGKPTPSFSAAAHNVLAEQLAAYPLDVVHVSEDSDVDKFLLDPVVDYVAAVAAETGPALLLIPNTLSGRDVAGRLSARLKAGLAADVTEFHIAGGAVACTAPKMAARW